MSSWQLELVGWGMGVCVYLPSQCWGPMWLGCVWALCMLLQSLWAHMCISPVVSGRHCVLGVFHPHWHWGSSCFLFCIAPWTLEEGLSKTPIRTECLRVSQHIVHLWVFVFVSVCCWRKLLGWWLSKALISKHSRVSLGVILSVHSFSRIVVFGFPLGPWPIWSEVLGHLISVRHGFHLLEWALNPIRQ